MRARILASALAALLLSCATSDNASVIAELEQHASANRDDELERRIRAPHPYSAERGATRAVLAMSSAKVPVVEGAINGVSMPLLLDTGTTHVVVSGAAARDCELYLPPGRTVSLITPGYEARFRLGAPRSITLGGTVLSGGVAVVGEKESGLARRLGLRAASHATIGAAVLSNFVMVLDFGKREVILEPHGGEPFAGVLWTEVVVNDKRCLMLVDTGANGIFLEPTFARSLGLIDQREVERHMKKAETAGAARFTPVQVKRVTIGGHTFEKVRAHVVNVVDNDGSLETLPRGGLLGIAGLGPHRWTIDYAKKQLVLEKAR